MTTPNKKLLDKGRSEVIREDIDGAPFHLGQEVKVCKRLDETVSTDFIGKIGTVSGYEYSSGVGQEFPKRPMIEVKFDTEVVEFFWPEELK